MPRWIRFSDAGTVRFGTLEGDAVRVHEGDMFGAAEPTGVVLRRADVRMLRPVEPGKVIVMYNNFGELLRQMKLAAPAELQYLFKPPNTYLDPDAVIPKPPFCDSRIIFEGELGIVIGRRCKNVPEAEALAHVFGYTCANDVTAADVLTRDPSFPHWARAKGFDGFCPFGPAIATGLAPETLTVRTFVNGSLRQHYPLSDMLFSVSQLVSGVSRDMTLNPGDLILCGTSSGVGVMRPGSLVEIEIEGIGRLSNHFETVPS